MDLTQSKIKIIILFFLTLTIKVNAQEKVLKDFDFKNHDYSFYIIYQYNDFRFEDSLPSIKPFIISDKEKLQQLKNDWIAKKEVDGMLLCGYDYKIYIVEHDSLIGHLNVNTDCGQVMAYGIGTSYDFEPYNHFKDLISDSEAFDTVLRADTITEARILYNKIKTTDSIYYPNSEFQEWIDFDGQFYFYVREKDTINGLKKFSEIEKDIYAMFPDKQIHVDFWGFSRDEYDGYLLCDSLFFMDLKENIPNWDDFKFIIPKQSKWEAWYQISSKESFSAYIISDSKKRIDKMIKTAGNNVYKK
ncbi:MAG: hypothetical protein U0W24_21320 [Bacteroidales bacterium]